MYRKVDDFLMDWKQSSDGTFHVLDNLTDDSLQVSIVEGHNSLGWLAWHLVGAASLFPTLAGLSIHGVSEDEEQPKSAHTIAKTYKKIAEEVSHEAEKLTDASLLEQVDSMFGPIERGKLLRILIDHQTHHRGQMTVLLRQAGLPVPPVMGPTKEMQ